MSEPTKEALELAERIDCMACGKLHIRGQIAATAKLIDAHTASLREELRAAREALDTVLTGNEEGGLQYWIRKHDALLLEVLEMPERAACKGGEAV